MNKEYMQAGRIQQKQKTRLKILAGAKKLLTEGKSFTLEDIAQTTSLSRATIYRYYSNTEALSIEAALDLGTKSTEEILESVDSEHITEVLHGIQDYFIKLSLDNEATFRKYLSVVINTPQKHQRGARRKLALEMAFKNHRSELSKSDQKKLIAVATALMGVEPLIVSKDVCGLSNKESHEVLSWALKMIILGLETTYGDL